MREMGPLKMFVRGGFRHMSVPGSAFSAKGWLNDMMDAAAVLECDELS
jgi:hypothetical protein